MSQILKPAVSRRGSRSDSESVIGNGGYGRQRKERHCQFCEKTFFKTDHLLRHERSHTKERPFRCELCRKVYSRHDTLLRHKKSHDANRSDLQAGVALLEMNQVNDMELFNNSHDVASFSMEQQSPYPTPPSVISPCDTQATGNISLRDSFSSQPQEYPMIYPSIPTSMSSPGLHIPHDDNTTILQNPYSSDIISPNSTMSMGTSIWESSARASPPVWISGDFDINALNNSFSMPMAVGMSDQFQAQTPSDIMEDVINPPEMGVLMLGRPHRRSVTRSKTVRKVWFTYLDEDETDGIKEPSFAGAPNPMRSSANSTEESANGNNHSYPNDFRSSVSQKLLAHANNGTLPSENYLNITMSIYFAKFNALFPIIHSQTFRAGPKNTPLILSMCTIGSLLIGSKGAVALGSRMFERFNKSIPATWEKAILSDPIKAKLIVQASLIAQTFGLLSGFPNHLALVEAFHGTIIAWAHRCNLFRYKSPQPNLEGLTGDELNEAWKNWARSEEIVRTVLGLYIHDAKLASLFHREPLLRHEGITICPAADDDIFYAPTAISWKEKMLLQSPNKSVSVPECLHSNLHPSSEPLPEELKLKNSRFTAYAILQGISATVCGKQQMGQLYPGSAESSEAFNALICWYYTFEKDKPGRNTNEYFSSDVFCLMILWHSVFINLLADVDRLERAVGRDGMENVSTESDQAYARKWASSIEARRCIFHAYALQKTVGTMPLDTEPAIHVPHCMFIAAVITYACNAFRQQTWKQKYIPNTPFPVPVNTEFPEFILRGIPISKLLQGLPTHHCPASLSSNNGGFGGLDGGPLPPHAPDHPSRYVPFAGGLLRLIADMLCRSGHWGIARKYLEIIETLVAADIDEWVVST